MNNQTYYFSRKIAHSMSKNLIILFACQSGGSSSFSSLVCNKLIRSIGYINSMTIKVIRFLLICLLTLKFLSAQAKTIPVLQTGGHVMPDEWIDQSTGHEIVRLSRRDGNNRSFYFHNDPFLKASDGKWVIFRADFTGKEEMYAVKMKKR